MKYFQINFFRVNLRRLVPIDTYYIYGLERAARASSQQIQSYILQCM